MHTLGKSYLTEGYQGRGASNTIASPGVSALFGGGTQVTDRPGTGATIGRQSSPPKVQARP